MALLLACRFGAAGSSGKLGQQPDRMLACHCLALLAYAGSSHAIAWHPPALALHLRQVTPCASIRLFALQGTDSLAHSSCMDALTCSEREANGVLTTTPITHGSAPVQQVRFLKFMITALFEIRDLWSRSWFGNGPNANGRRV